ncbi:hypothetical protein [Helicobacter monodelphidis]|uniref:hypothetical protein n=1 Tax=Helicobacter sp. 15-1451 TaxID=2004995 RepID=UPI00215B9255|nr:hypothetical protein [Helicobacter sp. 15-1451]
METTAKKQESQSSKKVDNSSLFLFWVTLLLAILVLGIYIGTLFFGANSLEVLLDLRKRETELLYKVERLRSDNAKLQKEYFELKGLEP